MKKTYLMMAAASALLFASCSRDVEGYTYEEAQALKYEQAFASQFGKISATQDWGFGSATSAARTRGVNADANNWGDIEGINVPQPLTEAQKEVVRKWFQTHQNPSSVAVDYKDFFVQQVYVGHSNTTGSQSTEEYLAGNGTVVIGAAQMDYLVAGQVGTYTDYLGNEVAMYDHIYDFNGSDYSGGLPNENVWDGTLDPSKGSDKNDQKVYHSDQIIFMQNSSTSSFGYKSSQSSEDYHDKYVVIPGDRIDPIVAGMYFVGFDYDALGYNSNQYCVHKDANGDIEINGEKYSKGGADGYYSDWIVRITEAYGSSVVVTDPVVEQGRVFCEDLGSIGDFDFNDVVFDATRYQSGKFDITVLAGGGIYSATVAGRDVHQLLGGYDMVNTGAGHSAPAASFTITAEEAEQNAWTNIKSLPIVISSTSQAGENREILLQAEIGKAPQKILVPLNTPWAREYQNINNVYTNFKHWVNGDATADETFVNPTSGLYFQ